MLKIYGRANSINVRKVLWLAEELGLQYEREDWGRGFQPVTDPEFTAINPLALVPAINDDGFVLSESHAILRYLAAKHGRTDLLPTDLRQRALIERWMEWQGTEYSNSCRAAFIGGVVKAPVPGGNEAIMASMEEWPKKTMMIERQLEATGKYIAGPEFTLADIPIGLGINRWFTVDLPAMQRPDLPATSAYYDRLSERPAFMKHGRSGTP